MQAFILPTKKYERQNVICNAFKQKQLSHDVQLSSSDLILGKIVFWQSSEIIVDDITLCSFIMQVIEGHIR